MAMARPMPRPAPVMTATLPSSSGMFTSVVSTPPQVVRLARPAPELRSGLRPTPKGDLKVAPTWLSAPAGQGHGGGAGSGLLPVRVLRPHLHVHQVLAV